MFVGRRRNGGGQLVHIESGVRCVSYLWRRARRCRLYFLFTLRNNVDLLFTLHFVGLRPMASIPINASRKYNKVLLCLSMIYGSVFLSHFDWALRRGKIEFFTFPGRILSLSFEITYRSESEKVKKYIRFV